MTYDFHELSPLLGNPAGVQDIITKQKLDAISPILDKDDMKKLEKCSSEDKNLMKSQSESSSLTESSPDERLV